MSESTQTPPDRFDHIARLIFVRIPHVLIGTLFIIAALINIANVVGRYVFSAPIFWAEEVLVFIVIWSVCLAAVSVTYLGAHLSMDLLYVNLPPAWKRAINIVVLVCFIGCALFVAGESLKSLLQLGRSNPLSVGAEIPLVIPHSAVLVGFSLMALAVLARLRSYLTGKFD